MKVLTIEELKSIEKGAQSTVNTCQQVVNEIDQYLANNATRAQKINTATRQQIEATREAALHQIDRAKQHIQQARKQLQEQHVIIEIQPSIANVSPSIKRSYKPS